MAVYEARLSRNATRGELPLAKTDLQLVSYMDGDSTCFATTSFWPRDGAARMHTHRQRKTEIYTEMQGVFFLSALDMCAFHLGGVSLPRDAARVCLPSGPSAQAFPSIGDWMVLLGGRSTLQAVRATHVYVQLRARANRRLQRATISRACAFYSLS